MPKKKLIGVLINPLAGIGGRVGLKGSDGPDTVKKALALGAVPESPKRAALALTHLLPLKDTLRILTFSGDMGETVLRSLGFDPEIAGSAQSAPTTAADTLAAAALFEEQGVACILFAGGDGTARVLYEAVRERVPVIGIPAGVKMHSAVYAVNPRNAGLAAFDFLSGKLPGFKQAEVMDIDEDLFRDGRVNARLYGYMTVPDSGSRIQGKKAGGKSEATELSGMARSIADSMRDNVLYIVGPGSTTLAVTDELGLEGTLLGVDVLQNRRLVLRDATESALWDLLRDPALIARIIVTVIGGQGSLFGRGNQQISPRILRRVGRENIIVVSTTSKILGLHGEPLLVDTGDADLDEALKGYIEVVTGYGQSICYPVSN